MSNSSAPPTYSTISTDSLYTSMTDTITITTITGMGLDTMTIPTGSNYMYTASPSISGLTTTSIPSLTINDINPVSFTWGKDFVDKFPEWDRIKSMCDQYPSLEIALRNFETIYQLVKDDYDNPTPKK